MPTRLDTIAWQYFYAHGEDGTTNPVTPRNHRSLSGSHQRATGGSPAVGHEAESSPDSSSLLTTPSLAPASFNQSHVPHLHPSPHGTEVSGAEGRRATATGFREAPSPSDDPSTAPHIILPSSWAAGSRVGRAPHLPHIPNPASLAPPLPCHPGATLWSPSENSHLMESTMDDNEGEGISPPRIPHATRGTGNTPSGSSLMMTTLSNLLLAAPGAALFDSDEAYVLPPLLQYFQDLSTLEVGRAPASEAAPTTTSQNETAEPPVLSPSTSGSPLHIVPSRGTPHKSSFRTPKWEEAEVQLPRVWTQFDGVPRVELAKDAGDDDDGHSSKNSSSSSVSNLWRPPPVMAASPTGHLPDTRNKANLVSTAAPSSRDRYRAVLHPSYAMLPPRLSLTCLCRQHNHNNRSDMVDHNADNGEWDEVHLVSPLSTLSDLTSPQLPQQRKVSQGSLLLSPMTSFRRQSSVAQRRGSHFSPRALLLGGQDHLVDSHLESVPSGLDCPRHSRRLYQHPLLDGNQDVPFVFANYAQPPLQPDCFSIEHFPPRLQEGLKAMQALVEEQLNVGMTGSGGVAEAKIGDEYEEHLGNVVTGTSSSGLGFTSESGDDVAASATPAELGDTSHGRRKHTFSLPTPPSGAPTARGIKHSLNTILQRLIRHNEREVALHVVLLTLPWRFAPPAERIVIFFNHIRSCLPSNRFSTVTLALEACCALQHIDAPDVDCTRIAEEFMTIILNYIRHGCSYAELLTGLIATRHILRWRSSRPFRKLITTYLPELILSTWNILMREEWSKPMHRLREIAAATLQDLLVEALMERRVIYVQNVVATAVNLFLQTASAASSSSPLTNSRSHAGTADSFEVPSPTTVEVTAVGRSHDGKSTPPLSASFPYTASMHLLDGLSGTSPASRSCLEALGASTPEAPSTTTVPRPMRRESTVAHIDELGRRAMVGPSPTPRLSVSQPPPPQRTASMWDFFARAVRRVISVPPSARSSRSRSSVRQLHRPRASSSPLLPPATTVSPPRWNTQVQQTHAEVLHTPPLRAEESSAVGHPPSLSMPASFHDAKDQPAAESRNGCPPHPPPAEIPSSIGTGLSGLRRGLSSPQPPHTPTESGTFAAALGEVIPPSHLEVRMTAASLTIGAFVCAWRKASRGQWPLTSKTTHEATGTSSTTIRCPTVVVKDTVTPRTAGRERPTKGAEAPPTMVSLPEAIRDATLSREHPDVSVDQNSPESPVPHITLLAEHDVVTQACYREDMPVSSVSSSTDGDETDGELGDLSETSSPLRLAPRRESAGDPLWYSMSQSAPSTAQHQPPAPMGADRDGTPPSGRVGPRTQQVPAWPKELQQVRFSSTDIPELAAENERQDDSPAPHRKHGFAPSLDFFLSARAANAVVKLFLPQHPRNAAAGDVKVGPGIAPVDALPRDAQVVVERLLPLLVPCYSASFTPEAAVYISQRMWNRVVTQLKQGVSLGSSPSPPTGSSSLAATRNSSAMPLNSSNGPGAGEMEREGSSLWTRHSPRTAPLSSSPLTHPLAPPLASSGRQAATTDCGSPRVDSRMPGDPTTTSSIPSSSSCSCFELEFLTASLFTAAVGSLYPPVLETLFASTIYPALCHGAMSRSATFSRPIFPSLGLLVLNFGTAAAERCAPMVERVCRLCMQSPFSIELATVSSVLCSVYPQLRRVTQSLLARRMMEVLRHQPNPNSLRRLDKSPDRSCLADPQHTFSASTPLTTDGRSAMSSSPPRAPQGNAALFLGSTEADRAELTPAQRLEAKRLCFRVLQLYPYHWEGMTAFFLDVCTPYLHHSDEQLRRECVQSSVRALESDCFFPNSQGVIDRPERGRFLDDSLDYSSTHLQSPHTCNITRASEQTTSVGLGRGGVLIERDSSAAAAVVVQRGKHLLFVPPSIPSAPMPHKGTNISLPPPVCERHCGRTHVSTVREVVHQLVAVAVGDLEDRIRTIALRSLTPNTYQFLYAHEHLIGQLFVVLNDPVLENRVVAIRLLRNIAPSNPPLTYPPMRKVLQQLLDNFESRCAAFFYSQIGEREQHERQPAGITSSASSPVTFNGFPIFTAGSNIPIGCMTDPSLTVHAASLAVLTEIALCIPESTPIYLRRILLMLQFVLRNPRSDREAVVNALRLLTVLHEDSATEDWFLFRPFIRTTGHQLTIRDGDVVRMMSALAALQSILQSSEATTYAYVDLHDIVTCLHSLLYQKPSIGSDLSIAVLRLLGTISSIEPPHLDDMDRMPALIRRPDKPLEYPDLNAFLSDDANLQRYDVRDEPLGGHMIVPQLSRFHLFTSLLWPDVVIRVLLTAVFDYLSCTVTFTAEGLCECVDCIMRILSETTAVGRVAVYLPTMLTIVLNLISERHRAGHLQYTIVPGLLPLFLNSLAHLVSHVGRSIAPMYRLLHNFLIASWNLRQPTILNGCQLLQALCTAVPDLMKEHCQVWLMRLLTAITTYHRVEQSYVNMTLLHDPLNLDDTLTGHPLKKSGEDADLDLGGTTSAQLDLNPSGQAPGWNSILEAVYDRITTTIRMFQPLANVAARQMVCLNLSQALCEARSHGSNNMDLMKDERELLASTVNRLISKVLVEYIANCDVRTVATAIIENCMHHLHLLANIHMDALKQLRDESEWSKGHSSVASPGSTITSLPASPFRADQDTLPSRQVKTPRVQMAAVGNSAPQGPTRKAFRNDDHRREWEELLIEHRRRNFGGLCGGDEWWHCDSPLMRVGLRTAEGSAEVVRYFPLQSVRTSWESFAEMDILGCLLMILGRCRIQSVHYSVMVQAYVRLRFGDDEVLTVTSFFRCASSPLYRVELLGVMSQEAVDQLIRNPTVVIQRNKEDADATYANRCSLPDAMTARSEDVEHATGLDTAPFTPLEPSEWQNMSFEDLSLSHPGIPVVQVPSTTSLPIALSLRLAAAGVSPKLHSLASSQRSVPTGISAQEPPSRCSVPPEVSASGEQRVTEEETPLDFPPFLSREASFTDTRNSGAANRRLHPTLTSDPTNEINTSFYASRDDDTRREASSIPTAVGREELRFFEHHARLRPDKWRLWLERFCIMVAEAAPDPSVSICAHLIKQHRTSLMYSDLLPVALLSLWTSCTSTDDLREWMVAIRTFYRFHAHVPQLVAMEIARIGHFILLFAPSIFDEQINRTIIDVYITPTFVAELAHRASNPPLALFHVEQDLLRSFSAEKASFLVDVLDEVNALHDYSLVVDDPQLKLALIQFFSTSTTAVDIHRDIPRPVRLELGDSRSDERNTLLKDFLLHSDLCAARRYLQYSFAGSGESSSSGGQASSSGAQASMSGSTAPSEEDSAADLSLMEVLFAMRFFSRVLDFESVLRLWSSTKRKLGTSPWEMVSGIGNGSRGMARSTAAPIARPISLSGSMDVSRSPPSTARRRPQRSQVVTIVGEEVLLTNSAATPEMLVGSAGTNGSDPLAACLATCPSNERLVDQELPHPPPEMGAGRITSIMPSPGATTMPNYNLPLYIARYAIVAAESLCRWDEVLRAAQFAREYESFALHPSLDGPGMAHPCSSSSDGTRTDRTKRFPERSPFRQGTEGASSPLAEEAGHHTGPDRQSPFQHQIDIFRAAAFASEGNYDRAKQTLTNVQNSLKDYYAVFHTEHTQLMLELNCMFQQVSNLEEGIHAIELSTMDDDSSSPQALPVAGDHSLTTRSLTAEELGREVNGRLFKISTIRRLRNVGCRPLPMGSTVLQRYEVIAVRSALIPAHWQISNILILTEQMDKEGLPFRSVRSLEHFARLPIHTRNFQAVKEYRETLELERLRRLVRLLSSTEEMECLYMDICIALRTDLALTRFGPKDGSPLTARAQMELEQQIRGTMCSDMAYVKVEDLGNSLTPYQAELVLLHMYSTRRLKLAHRFSNVANTLPTKAVNDQQRWYNLPRFSPIPAMNMCRRSADDLPLYGEEENEALLTEYYLLEHTISVSNYLPSIWREFGLLLFEVCLAMHHEWEATNDPATLRNFLEQSAKAMAALQQGAQMWRSASLGAVHGIGPFSTASQRRQRHSRGMLPSSSMMLKVLYLAVKCEESMAAVADVPVAASLGASSMSVHEKLAGSHWHSVTGYAESDKRGSTASNNQADHPDQGGFGALDFRAPMLVLWASIIPHLVWTATIYAPIRLAVRDLCVKWTSMLHQMIFTLIACFEHPYEMVGGRASPLAESTPADLGAASASCTHGSFSGWPKSTSTAADSRTVDHSGMSVYGSPKLRGLSQGSPNSPVGGLADRDSVFATSTTAEPSSSACRYLPTDIRSGTPAIQSSFLRDIAAASPDHRRIVEETLAFCHFIGDASSGSELSLSGSCRLPAPVWQLPTLVMDTDPNSGGENHPDESVAPPLTSPHNDPGSEEGMAFTQRMDGGYKSVSHVRRYIVPGESPHYSREDVYTLFLSDGWKIRMHYAIERPPVSSSEEPEAGLSCWNLPCTTDVSRHHGSPTSVGPSSPMSSPTGRFPSCLPSGSPLLESAEMRSLQSAEVIMPYSLMEIAVCTLIGHLPLDSLRRPLVLPIGMDKFLTQLPSRVRRSTTWPTQLPESTHHTSLIQAHRKPTSLYYTHDEYCDCLHREDTLKVKQELFSSLSGTAGFSASVTSLETPIMTSVPRLPFELPDIAEAELRCSHVRQQNKLAYHNAMTTAMDTGDVGPLKTLVENTLEQRPSSEGTSSIKTYEYFLSLPRPVSHLKMLLQRIQQVELTVSMAPSSVAASEQDDEENASDAEALTEQQREAQRLCVLDIESCRHGNALRHAFAADGMDPSHWLNARRRYTQEMAEWSVVTFLLDMYHRETGNFFIDTSSGHVATHRLGRYTLQSTPERRRATSCKRSSDRIRDAEGSAGLLLTQEDALRHPFPNTDPTVFRLTRSLRNALSVESPHARFQSHTALSLYEIYNYSRDISDYSTFGLDVMTGFAWRPTTPRARVHLRPMLPRPPVHANSHQFPLSGALSTPLDDLIQLDPSISTAVGEESMDVALPVVFPSNESACHVTGVGNGKSISTGTDGDDLNGSASTRLPSSYAPLPFALDSSMRLPRSRRVIGSPLSPPTASCSQIHNNCPVGASGILPNIRRQLPCCFDGQSMRIKLRCDEPLFRLPDVEFANRAIILDGMRKRRAQVERGHGAVSMDDADSPLPPLSRDETEHFRHVAASMASHSADARSEAAPTQYNTAYGFASRLIAVSTDAKNLLGSEAAPHSASRWAPHW